MKIDRATVKKQYANQDYYINSKYFGIGDNKTKCEYCGEIITSEERIATIGNGLSGFNFSTHADCREYWLHQQPSQFSGFGDLQSAIIERAKNVG